MPSKKQPTTTTQTTKPKATKETKPKEIKAPKVKEVKQIKPKKELVPKKKKEVKPRKRPEFINGVPYKEYMKKYMKNYMAMNEDSLIRKRIDKTHSNNFLQKAFQNNALFLLANHGLFDRINDDCGIVPEITPPLKMLLQTEKQIRYDMNMRHNATGDDIQREQDRITKEINKQLKTGELRIYYVRDYSNKGNVVDSDEEDDEEDEVDEDDEEELEFADESKDEYELNEESYRVIEFEDE